MWVLFQQRIPCGGLLKLYRSAGAETWCVLRLPVVELHLAARRLTPSFPSAPCAALPASRNLVAVTDTQAPKAAVTDAKGLDEQWSAVMDSSVAAAPKSAAAAADTPGSPASKRGRHGGAAARSTPVVGGAGGASTTGEPANDASRRRGRLRVTGGSPASSEAAPPSAAKRARTSKSPARSPGADASGTAPSARWGHSATPLSETTMLVYGGSGDEGSALGDARLLNLLTDEWASPINFDGVPRVWHCATLLPHKKAVFVFGGERDLKMGAPEYLTEPMLLDTDLLVWYAPAINGPQPCARAGHTLSLVRERQIVVFGGTRGRAWLDDAFVLDTEKWRWTPLKASGRAPAARCYHSATVVGESNEKVVFFGGNAKDESFNDVVVLEHRTGDEDADGDSRGDSWSWCRPVVVGTPPCARTGHTATAVSPTEIVITGGWDPVTEREDDDEEAVPLADMWKLDTAAWTWERVRDDKAAQRVGHTAVFSAESGEVVLFGGVDQLQERRDDVARIAV